MASETAQVRGWLNTTVTADVEEQTSIVKIGLESSKRSTKSTPTKESTQRSGSSWPYYAERFGIPIKCLCFSRLVSDLLVILQSYQLWILPPLHHGHAPRVHDATHDQHDRFRCLSNAGWTQNISAKLARLLHSLSRERTAGTVLIP
jgi:hypothetical protein